jgi:hypothetical protein
VGDRHSSPSRRWASPVLVAAVACAQVTKKGNLEIEIEGSVSPTKLSRTTPQPITLHLSGKAGTTDGSHVPPLKELFVEFDRNGHLGTRGLPTCTVGKLQSTLTSQVSKGKGPYGTAARVKIPAITSGQGSLTSFQATIFRSSIARARSRAC